MELPQPEYEHKAAHKQLPTGARCGAALVSVFWAVLVLAGAVACVLQARELFGAGGDRARRLQWEGYDPDDYEQTSEEDMWMYQLIQLLVFLIVCVLEIMTFLCYYRCYIKPSYEKFIPKNAIIPESLKDRWKHGIFDCFGDLRTCCCFTWCAPCATADLWYRVGWIHALLQGSNYNTPGWQWFVGVFGYVCMTGMGECCVPCILAVLRGGAGFIDGSDESRNDLMPMRSIFGLEHTGWGTFCGDCCCYCWCGPCVATQEYRQVIAVFQHGPVQVAAPQQGNMVVGNPVVGQPVVAQGMPVQVTAK